MHYVVNGDFVTVVSLMGHRFLVPNEKKMSEIHKDLKSINLRIYGRSNNFSIEFVLSLTQDEKEKTKSNPTRVLMLYKTAAEECNFDDIRKAFHSCKHIKLEGFERIRSAPSR